MLELKIHNMPSIKEYDYVISYIDFLNGVGHWKNPIGNDCSKGLSKEQAKYITKEILKTLDRCLEEIKHHK